MVVDLRLGRVVLSVGGTEAVGLCAGPVVIGAGDVVALGVGGTEAVGLCWGPVVIGVGDVVVKSSAPVGTMTYK